MRKYKLNNSILATEDQLKLAYKRVYKVLSIRYKPRERGMQFTY